MPASLVPGLRLKQPWAMFSNHSPEWALVPDTKGRWQSSTQIPQYAPPWTSRKQLARRKREGRLVGYFPGVMWGSLGLCDISSLSQWVGAVFKKANSHRQKLRIKNHNWKNNIRDKLHLTLFCLISERENSKLTALFLAIAQLTFLADWSQGLRKTQSSSAFWGSHCFNGEGAKSTCLSHKEVYLPGAAPRPTVM